MGQLIVALVLASSTSRPQTSAVRMRPTQPGRLRPRTSSTRRQKPDAGWRPRPRSASAHPHEGRRLTRRVLVLDHRRTDERGARDHADGERGGRSVGAGGTRAGARGSSRPPGDAARDARASSSLRSRDGASRLLPREVVARVGEHRAQVVPQRVSRGRDVRERSPSGPRSGRGRRRQGRGPDRSGLPPVYAVPCFVRPLRCDSMDQLVRGHLAAWTL